MTLRYLALIALFASGCAEPEREIPFPGPTLGDEVVWFDTLNSAAPDPPDDSSQGLVATTEIERCPMLRD